MTIRELLTDPPMTLNELARQAGVNVGHLWRLKQGTRNLTPELAGRLAEVFEAGANEYRERAKTCSQAARALRRTTRKRGGT